MMRAGFSFKKVEVKKEVRKTATIGLKARAKVRPVSGGQPSFELAQGDDYSRDSQKWVKLRRVIDRKNDIYEEVITDPTTRRVVRQVKEPLSQHQGHGSAKLMRSKSADGV